MAVDPAKIKPGDRLTVHVRAVRCTPDDLRPGDPGYPESESAGWVTDSANNVCVEAQNGDLEPIKVWIPGSAVISHISVWPYAELEVACGGRINPGSLHDLFENRWDEASWEVRAQYYEFMAGMTRMLRPKDED